MVGLKTAAENFKVSPAIVAGGIPLAIELFGGVRRRPPAIEGLPPITG